MILAVLPIYKCYSKITVFADLIATRWSSQIGNFGINADKVILLEQFNNRDAAERLNHHAILDAIKFEKFVREKVLVKGISIADADIRQIWSKVFCQVYRESLSILSIIKEKNIKIVVIERKDQCAYLYEEILPQLNVKLEYLDSFGIEDSYATSLLKKEYPSTFTINFHPIKKIGWKLKAYVMLVNLLSSIVRLMNGKKPSLIFSLYKPLEPIKNDLLFGYNYYSIIHQIGYVGFIKMVQTGMKVFLFEYILRKDRATSKIISKYQKSIDKALKNVNAGKIAYSGIKIDVSVTLGKMLNEISAVPFYQIANNINISEKLFKNNMIAGYFGFCDSPWEERLIIRQCQKRNIPNAIMINGVLSNSHYIEAKTADNILVYSQTQKNNYLKDHPDKVKVVGNPLYEESYQKKKTVPHPPVNVIVGTSDFCPGDINCSYYATEKYLADVVFVLDELRKRYCFKFWLKLHPGESREYYEWLILKENICVEGLYDSEKMQDVLSKADLFISNHSVAVFEASLMGIPVVYYHPAKQVLYDPFSGSESLSSSFNREELKEEIEKIFNDKSYSLRFTDICKLEYYTGPMDRSARDRIKSVLNKFLELSSLRKSNI